MDIPITSGVLLLTLYLLITEIISVDLTAIGIMVILVAVGILTPVEAVAGFANPAVITVGAMFVVSKGLMRTGGVEFLGRRITQMAGNNYKLARMALVYGIFLAKNHLITLVKNVKFSHEKFNKFYANVARFLQTISRAGKVRETQYRLPFTLSLKWYYVTGFCDQSQLYTLPLSGQNYYDSLMPYQPTPA